MTASGEAVTQQQEETEPESAASPPPAKMPLRIYVRRQAPEEDELQAAYWSSIEYCSLPFSPQDIEGTATLGSYLEEILGKRMPEVVDCVKKTRNENVVIQVLPLAGQLHSRISDQSRNGTSLFRDAGYKTSL